MTKLVVVLVVIAIVISANTIASETAANTEPMKQLIKLDKFQPCGSPPHKPIMVRTLVIRYNKELGNYVDIAGELRQDLNSQNINIKAHVQRCANKEALDTCELFGVLKPTNVCMFLSLNGMGMQEIANSFTPQLKCPFKKNNYTGHIKLKASYFNMFPTLGFYWKVNVSSFENHNYLGSLCADGQIFVSH